MNWLHYVLVVSLGAVGLLGSPDAHADATCWINGSGMSFGSVDPSEMTDVTGYIDYQCDVSSPGNSGKSVSIQMCIGLGSTPGGTLSDRRMDGVDDAVGPNPDQLRFQLYKDAARSAPWGETVTSAPPYFEMPPFTAAPPRGESETIRGRVLVHGRIPPPGGLVAAGNYASSLPGNLNYGYRDDDDSDKVDCLGDRGSQTGSDAFFFPVDATVPGSCTVLTATDMDFSPGGTLFATRTGDLTSTSTIDLECTNRTAWQVGLNNGANGLAADGTSRQLCIAGGACIRYQLNRPASHGGGRWGNDLDGGSDTVTDSSSGTPQSLTVNGVINDQPLTQAGLYSDTITVTLTY